MHSKYNDNFFSKGTINNVYERNYNVLASKPNSIQKYNFDRNENLVIGNSRGYSLNDFHFLGKNLGQGQYATVRKAQCKIDKKHYAIKTYNRMQIPDTLKKKAIISEIEILESLDHQNIIRSYCKFENTRNIHIVMDFAGEVNLKQFLAKRKRGKLQENEAKHIF